MPKPSAVRAVTPAITAREAAAPNVSPWRPACTRRDLVANAGVVALVDGCQVALFYLPEIDGQTLYALDNRDPKSGANVIGRGIVGHLGGELVVASPMYKQHFRLRDGACVEIPDQSLRAWPARLHGDVVEVAPPVTG